MGYKKRSVIKLKKHKPITKNKTQHLIIGKKTYELLEKTTDVQWKVKLIQEKGFKMSNSKPFIMTISKWLRYKIVDNDTK